MANQICVGVGKDEYKGPQDDRETNLFCVSLLSTAYLLPRVTLPPYATHSYSKEPYNCNRTRFAMPGQYWACIVRKSQFLGNMLWPKKNMHTLYIRMLSLLCSIYRCYNMPSQTMTQTNTRSYATPNMFLLMVASTSLRVNASTSPGGISTLSVQTQMNWTEALGSCDKLRTELFTVNLDKYGRIYEVLVLGCNTSTFLWLSGFEENWELVSWSFLNANVNACSKSTVHSQ